VGYEAGQIIETPYPFVRSTYEFPITYEPPQREKFINGWSPGCKFVEFFDYDGIPSGGFIANAMGHSIVEIISIYKPGKYPIRYFYTRKWRDPDGKVFGKNRLKIKSQGGFNGDIGPYRFEFDIEDTPGENYGK